MNIVTKKHLSRRTVLRGIGAAIALPLLDGMVPAFAASGKTAAKSVKRLGVVLVPNGIVMPSWAGSFPSWTPATEGSGFEFTPVLKPLEPFRNHVLVLSGLANHEADAKTNEGSGDHARAQGTYLTGVHIKKTEGAVEAGISMDQIAAKELGKETQLASLEIGLDPNELSSCEPGYSCAYMSALSWRSATTPLPGETNPRAVFERLFGVSDNTDPAARAALLRKNASILDAVTQKATRLRQELDPRDGAKLTEYLEAVRDIERRIQNAEAQSDQELPEMDRPAGVPSSYEDYAKLMFDLQAVALQSDLTRVFTFIMGREFSQRPYPEIGVPDNHHTVSHHQNDPAKIAKLIKINAYHIQLFSYFVDKLKSTPDGDGSLLDHIMILYGSGLGNSDLHLHYDLGTLLVGGGTGQIRGGRHIRYAKDTPLMNLHLTLLNKLGIPEERIGDSTGTFKELSVA